MKTYEQHNKSTHYYAIRWVSVITNRFDGELEGHFNTLDEIMIHLFDNYELDVDLYDVDFKIIKVEETEISKDDVNLWLESSKYNL